MTTQTTDLPMAIELPEPIESSQLDEKDESGIDWEADAGEMNSGDTDVHTVEGNLEVLEDPKEETLPAATPVEPVKAAPLAPTPIEPVASPEAAPVAKVEPLVAAPVQTPISTEPFDIGKWEAEQRVSLGKMYVLSEKDAEDLQTQPELVLPRLAANLHLEITRSVMTAVQGMMPNMIQNLNQSSLAETQARDAFYGANADLKGHEAQVMQVAQMFRAANPTATRELAIKTIGEMTRMSLGLPPLLSTVPTEAAPQAVASAKPFSPARGGGGAAIPVSTPNMWSDLAKDD